MSALPLCADSKELVLQPAVEGAGDWHVLHTKSRQEKILADELAELRVPHFLPLFRHVRFYGKRKAMVDSPLFPGYLFLRGTREQAFEANLTHRVARVIPVTDQTKLDWELSNLRLALENDAMLDPYPCLKRGVAVEVRSGPFQGLQGLIEDRLHSNRLVLQVELLGRAVGLEVDGALLDPL